MVLATYLDKIGECGKLLDVKMADLIHHKICQSYIEAEIPT